MELCAGDHYHHSHEEICFEGGDCPLCQAQDELKEVEESRDDWEKKADDLDTELADLTIELDNLKLEQERNHT